MMRISPEKMMHPAGKEKEKEKEKKKNNRFLISVNVVGSAGPLRFVVNKDDKVSGVMETCLKMYAKGGRLPVLGTDFKNFLLYPSNAATDHALDQGEWIGMCGERNFILCKKQRLQMTEGRQEMIARKRGGSGWKAWINKSFNILSH